MVEFTLIVPTKMGVRERISPSAIPSKGPSAVTSSVYVGLKRLDCRFSVKLPSDILAAGVRPQEKLLFFGHGECSLQLIELLRINVQVRAPLIIGPNCELNSDVKAFLIENPDAYTGVVLPTRELLNDRSESKIKYIIWAAGVDEKYWKPRNMERRRVSIYKKGLMSEFDELLIDLIGSRLNLPIDVIKYGDYSRRQYRHLLCQSKFLIWLGVKETQGLALCEAWSMNVPTIIRISQSDESHKLNRSMAPLLSPQCGTYFDNVSDVQSAFKEIEIFMANLENYEPRNWILNELTCKMQAEKLLQLLT
jgi:hypothetical protein